MISNCTNFLSFSLRFFRDISFFLLFSLVFSSCRPSVVPSDRYVVVLSLDGFRPDYLDRAHTPTFDRIAREGLSSAFTPCFPSVTFANHYSMATGLHPSHHGIVKNHFYDPVTDRKYSVGDRPTVEDASFYGGEPLWNTAERQGVQAATLYWVGSEAPINGRYASRWKYYDGRLSHTARADTVLGWLSAPLEERPRLVMWYIEEPDISGHKYGTDSLATLQTVERLDSIVGYFLRGLESLPHYKDIDFLIVSDHGMANYYPDRYVNLIDYLPRDSFQHIYDGVPTLLHVKDTSYIDKAMELLSDVPHVDAYRRADVPARYVFSDNPRIGDIVVVPHLGTLLQFRNAGKARFGGTHGYDNLLPEMEALFMAKGPSFKAGTTHPAVPNITLYPLVCRLLGISPAPCDAELSLVDDLLGQ